MSTEAFAYTDHLQTLLARKVHVLELLRDLARLQADANLSGESEVLLSFLARKQPLMDALADLQTELEAYRHDDPEARLWRAPDLRQQCRSDSERCQWLLAEIVLLERQTLDDLNQRRDAVASQLQNGRDASAAAAAYHSSDSILEGSLDLTSAG
jgi:hypothetical protein